MPLPFFVIRLIVLFQAITALIASHDATIAQREAAATARWESLLDSREAVIASLEIERRHALQAFSALQEALASAAATHSALAQGQESTSVSAV